ncbi:MAG: hypothetical protein JSV78_09915 [Phycisphaerales bacterium]|nr:MAG: hypothetical protein JSV78_09915 [Phycisphaerales bacterium]
MKSAPLQSLLTGMMILFLSSLLVGCDPELMSSFASPYSVGKTQAFGVTSKAVADGPGRIIASFAPPWTMETARPEPDDIEERTDSRFHFGPGP